jgi:hypothetical protein
MTPALQMSHEKSYLEWEMISGATVISTTATATGERSMIQKVKNKTLRKRGM